MPLMSKSHDLHLLHGGAEFPVSRQSKCMALTMKAMSFCKRCLGVAQSAANKVHLLWKLA